MSLYETLAIIIASISLIVAVVAIIISLKNSKFVAGQIELQLSQNIDETKRHVTNIILQVSQYEDGNVPQLLEESLKSAVESNLNAYEGACGIYLDKKIDVKRFKKIYNNEIKRIVEDETHNKFFHPEGTSSYKAIWKVYKMWNDLEK